VLYLLNLCLYLVCVWVPLPLSPSHFTKNSLLFNYLSLDIFNTSNLQCTIFRSELFILQPATYQSWHRCERAFGVVAPKVWQDLSDSILSSDSIISFKNNLKAYLYHHAFTSWLATYSLRPAIECMPIVPRACNIDVDLT